MSFRFPVTTQEPLTVSGTRRRLASVRYNFNAGTLNSTNPYTHVVTVPQGSRWRLIGSMINWSQFAANRQYCLLNQVSKGTGDVTRRQICTDWRALTNINTAAGGYFGIWKIGNGCGRWHVNDGAVDYIQEQYALPDLWMDGNDTIEAVFYNATKNDVANLYVMYEEEVI